MDDNKDFKKITKVKHEDLFKLLSLLDECIDSMDEFYFYAKAKEMMSLSNNN